MPLVEWCYDWPYQGIVFAIEDAIGTNLRASDGYLGFFLGVFACGILLSTGSLGPAIGSLHVDGRCARLRRDDGVAESRCATAESMGTVIAAFVRALDLVVEMGSLPSVYVHRQYH